MKNDTSYKSTTTVLVNGVQREIKSTEKVVKNMMSQQDVVILKDTPMSCDPSTETYWSM